MAGTHQIEGLIRLGADGKEITDACCADGAATLSEQPIAFVELAAAPGGLPRERKTIDLKQIGGLSCC